MYSTINTLFVSQAKGITLELYFKMLIKPVCNYKNNCVQTILSPKCPLL